MTLTSYLWCGTPTETSLRPVFVLDGTATAVRAAVSTDAVFTTPTYSDPVTPDVDYACHPGDVNGLTPDTRYYYCAEIDGVLDTANIARARTMPATSRTMGITWGSCWAGPGQNGATTPNHAVGSAVAARHDAGEADLHCFAGDLGYLDLDGGNPERWRDSFASLHAQPHFAAMARASAWSTIWDDHDMGSNNRGGDYPYKSEASRQWRQFVPFPDLPDAKALYHAYDLSPDVRIVVSDLRYYRDPDLSADDVDKTMMGTTQKAWLKAEWLAAKNAGQLIVWVTSSVWGIDGAYATQGLNTDDDGWWAYSYERNELDNFRSLHGIKDMVILTGDGHQMSYRLGCDYSTAQDVPAPVFLCAAYSRTAAYRVGDWGATTVPSDAEGHYGLLTIEPQWWGWKVGADFRKVATADADNDVSLFSASVNFGNPPPPPIAPGDYVVNTGGSLRGVDDGGAKMIRVV